MERLRNVTGTWQGTYAYESPEQAAKRQPVPFTLILKQGWFGRFTGSVTEQNPAPRIRGGGVIEGYLSFPRIEFHKRMPVYYVALPDGRNITMRDCLIEQGHTCERDLPGPPIFYQGVFSSARRAQGTWIIQTQRIPLAGGVAIQTTETKGVWSIETRAECMHADGS